MIFIEKRKIHKLSNEVFDKFQGTFPIVPDTQDCWSGIRKALAGAPRKKGMKILFRNFARFVFNFVFQLFPYRRPTASWLHIL